MKKILFLLMLIPVAAFGQRYSAFDITDIAADGDTTLYLAAQNTTMLTVDFSSLTHNTDSIDIGYSDNKQGFTSVTTDFPKALDKSTIYKYSDGTRKSQIMVITTGKWPSKWIAIRYRNVDSTSGNLKITY